MLVKEDRVSSFGSIAKPDREAHPGISGPMAIARATALRQLIP